MRTDVRLLAGTRWKSHVERAWLAGADRIRAPRQDWAAVSASRPVVLGRPSGAPAPIRIPVAIHSGGMVICDRPIADVCPVEWARMENRSVLQWDKDDCAAIGLVKFDLLGLGMLSALHYVIDLVAEHKGIEVDLAKLDLGEPAVYEMLQRADSVGVFQVESRAQMATLPRLKPRVFYDLVVEVALIRPGPIQGGSVHPYIRRRNGVEPVTYDHPSMEPALRKTLGVPLFQEQLMQLAVDCAGFSAAEADQLRRAMGSKRSTERMRRLGQVLRRDARAARHHRRGGRPDLREAGGVRQFRLPGSHSLPSRRWCSTRRGSSCTIRRRSARRCCGRSRWASTRRSRWWPTPAGTASPCTARHQRQPGAGHAGKRGRLEVRLGHGSVRTSATSWPSGSSRNERPTGRSHPCSI